jgi:signal transduction histidine kinase
MDLSPGSDAARESEPLAEYRLRAVRIGLVCTAVVLLALVAVLFIPGHDEVQTVPYLIVLALASAGGLAVALLPWKKLFERGHGLGFLYVWSIADIALISMAVAVTGGGRSSMFVLYALTTVFFGSVYPQRGKLLLLLFTSVCYCAAIAVTGWDIEPAMLFARLAGIGVLAVLTAFLYRELLGQIRQSTESRAGAERWAALLSAVAGAAQRMTLDPDRVVDVVLDAVLALGFEGASLTALDPDGRTYRVLGSRGLPEQYAVGVYPAGSGVTGLVLSSGASVVLDDYSNWEHALSVAKAGYHAVIACPVRLDGWLAAVLIAGSKQYRYLPMQEVQAVELLAAQASMALQNARRFEAERRTVERLEELDRMKADFLATVSHELRTPLTVIEGVGLTLERAWDGLDDDTRHEMLLGLGANVRSLDSLITNLLDFSRLEAGGLEVQFEPVDMSELLLATATRLKRLFVDRRLEVDVDPGLGAQADTLLVDRVIENLLSNAAKHTATGAMVTLSAHVEGNDVVVVVADDGPGISEDDLAHLGERFFRGGDLNARPRGIGLGLALAREILELHESELQIESRMGHGSRFAFRLPRLGAGHRAAGPRAAARTS